MLSFYLSQRFVFIWAVFDREIKWTKGVILITVISFSGRGKLANFQKTNRRRQENYCF